MKQLKKNDISKDALLTTVSRWGNATEAEVGSKNNVLGLILSRNFDFSGPLDIILEHPLIFGFGPGLHSLLGKKLFPKGIEKFNSLKIKDYGESGFESTLLDYGTLLGTIFIFWRILLFLTLGKNSLICAFKRKNSISLFFWISVGYTVLYSYSTQTLNVGFMVFIGSIISITSKFQTLAPANEL